MRRKVLWAGLLLCAVGAIVLAQTAIAPKPPFTAAQAEHGKQIAAKSLEIRAQITNMRDPAESRSDHGQPVFCRSSQWKVYLLTSPQGHILFGRLPGYHRSD
jgi:hypothetical protein